MPTYALASPIPAIVNLGALVEGVSTSGGVVMWKDGSNIVHILGSFSGDAASGWYGHYINTDTDAHALVTGATLGCLNAPAYHPTQNKLYIGTGYAPSNQSTLIELDVTTTPPTVTKLKDQNLPAPIGAILIGDDNLVYYFGIGNVVYSYDPVVGLPGGWKEYGVVLAGLETGSNYRSMAVDSGYIYCGVLKSGGSFANGPWTFAITPTTGDVAWVEWEFGALSDKRVSIYQNQTTLKWMATRILSDDSVKHYWLHDGTYTEVNYIDNPAPDFIWNAHLHIPSQPIEGTVTPYLRSGADDNAFPAMLDYYNIDADFSVMYPVKEVWEQSLISYRPEGSEDPYTESTVAFTGPWTAQIVQAVEPIVSGVFGVASGYGAAFDLSADFVVSYEGFSCHSPYSSLRLSDGRIVVGGYASLVFLYDPSEAWTLTKTTATPTTPDDAGKPNPYFIVINPPLLHYRHGFAEDAFGNLWIGGNTTRGAPDYGNVCWYNLAAGDSDYLFDAWAAAGTLFRNICSCLNKTKILVANNVGEIYRVDAATKVDDAVTITPVASSKNYMIEMSYDRVFVVNVVSTTYTCGVLNPSTMTWEIALQALGVAGVPFGFADGQYTRMSWKPTVGPDGWPWMYVGNTLYRINPTTLAFSSVDATGTYGKITFTNGNRDLLWHGYNTTVKYYPDIFTRVDSKLVGGVVAGKVGGVTAEKVGGVQQ